MSNDTSTTAPAMLTGFTEFRNSWGGEGIEGSIPLSKAHDLIGWVPLESIRTASDFLTEDGVLTIEDDRAKILAHPVTHKVLGRHLDTYEVHPYADTLLRDARAISGGQLGIARVGTTRGGARAFVQYEMSETIQAGGPGAERVKFRPFLNAATSLDGSLASSWFRGTNVIECDNSLAAALTEGRRHGELYKTRHRKGSAVNVADARAALNIVVEIADEYTEAINDLTSQYVSDSQWKAFLEAIAPTDEKKGRALTLAENKQASLSRLWNTDTRVAPWRNSAWGVLSAVNTWVNWEQTVKGVDRIERNVEKVFKGDFERSDNAVLRILAEVSA
jgi:phage/plasmid-like protein (TIGR03299 family)